MLMSTSVAPTAPSIVTIVPVGAASERSGVVGETTAIGACAEPSAPSATFCSPLSGLARSGSVMTCGITTSVTPS